MPFPPMNPHVKHSVPAIVSCAVVALAWASPPGGNGAKEIDEKTVRTHVEFLAAPGLEGRDTPSEGLRRAARYIADRFGEFGLLPASDSVEVLQREGAEFGYDDAGEDALPGFLRPYRIRHEAPVPEDCFLALSFDGDELSFAFGRDFVPVSRCTGSARGELAFAGFGIDASSEHYDDFKGARLKDKIALIFEGEPRHRTRFDGPEITVNGSLWTKLRSLSDAGVRAVLVVRRAPEGAEEDDQNLLDFRHTFARFSGDRPPRTPRSRPPVLEVSMQAASRLLGTDAAKLVKRMDKSGRPISLKLSDREVSLAAVTAQRPVRVDNVVGLLPGTDPVLREEVVILGAHYDHIGVDARGRIGTGADDNASGTSAMLAVMEALAADPPRRTVLACAFSGEEDGLVGSRELAGALPVERGQVVAMVNLDMLGFGDDSELAVIGLRQNPGLATLVERARKHSKTGIRRLVTKGGEDLFRRSDQYSFHQIGLPVLFFFEGLPISRNLDYHTWRDRIEGVSIRKITRSARLVRNAIWLLASDDRRPPAPGR